jgi:hypothetical protein
LGVGEGITGLSLSLPCLDMILLLSGCSLQLMAETDGVDSKSGFSFYSGRNNSSNEILYRIDRQTLSATL